MWNPWNQARDDEELLIVFRDDLPDEVEGGAYLPDDEGGVIVLDSRLNQVERRSVLSHELVHHERGGGCDADFMPPQWKPRVVIDEQQTDDEAVDRLVPYSRLLRFVVELEMSCIHPEAGHVAEEFHVTERVAHRAMELLNQRLDEATERFYRKQQGGQP